MPITTCEECGRQSFAPYIYRWEHLPSCSIGQRSMRRVQERIATKDREIAQERERFISELTKPAWANHDDEFPEGCGNAYCHRCYGPNPRLHTVFPKEPVL